MLIVQLLDLSAFGTIQRFYSGFQSNQITSVSVEPGNYRISVLLILRSA